MYSNFDIIFWCCLSCKIISFDFCIYSWMYEISIHISVWVSGNKNMTVATHRNSISHGKYIFSRWYFENGNIWDLSHIYFIFETKWIESSYLLTWALLSYIRFVSYIVLVIWQDYGFIFEPSTGIRHSKFQYFPTHSTKVMAILAKRNDAWELSERKKERERERKRKRFTDVSRRHKGSEYISVPDGAIIYKIHAAQSRQV